MLSRVKKKSKHALEKKKHPTSKTCQDQPTVTILTSCDIKKKKKAFAVLCLRPKFTTTVQKCSGFVLGFILSGMSTIYMNQHEGVEDDFVEILEVRRDLLPYDCPGVPVIHRRSTRRKC